MIKNPFKIKSLSDEILIHKYQQTNNIDLLGQVYERYMHLVYGTCLKYLKNRDEAQDAVMGVFEKISTELLTRKVNDFKPWLYVVTKNFCLMELRKLKRQQVHQIEYEKNSSVFMEFEDEEHPYNNWEPDTLDARLKECMDKLKDQQRSCIELFYFQELCYKDISDNLNLDIKKVKSYIQNGKRNLKNCIESQA